MKGISLEFQKEIVGLNCTYHGEGGCSVAATSSIRFTLWFTYFPISLYPQHLIDGAKCQGVLYHFVGHTNTAVPVVDSSGSVNSGLLIPMIH